MQLLRLILLLTFVACLSWLVMADDVQAPGETASEEEPEVEVDSETDVPEDKVIIYPF